MPRQTYRDPSFLHGDSFGVFVSGPGPDEGRWDAVACAATITCLSWSGSTVLTGAADAETAPSRRHRARGARRTVPAERGRASAGLRHALVPHALIPSSPVDPVASVRDPARRIGSGVSAACVAGTRRFPSPPVTATNATWPALPGGCVSHRACPSQVRPSQVRPSRVCPGRACPGRASTPPAPGSATGSRSSKPTECIGSPASAKPGRSSRSTRWPQPTCGRSRSWGAASTHRPTDASGFPANAA